MQFPSDCHTRKNDLLDSQVAMMQYGGELVGNNLQQNERACRPPLSAKLIKPPCRRQGGLITYQEGGYER
jgi:hypothetical protein